MCVLAGSLADGSTGENNSGRRRDSVSFGRRTRSLKTLCQPGAGDKGE